MINAMRLNKYRLHLYDFRACLSFPFNERDLKVLSFLIDRILMCGKELISVSSFFLFSSSSSPCPRFHLYALLRDRCNRAAAPCSSHRRQHPVLVYVNIRFPAIRSDFDFAFKMSQLVFSVIGDSNVRRNMTPFNVRDRPGLSDAQVLSCSRLEVLPDARFSCGYT